MTTGERWLAVGEHIGGVDHETQVRMMIRSTIRSHLAKELKLNPQGIKVLSLFFIDKVSNYRSYNEEGIEIKGLYSRIFEEEMENFAKIPKYNELFVSDGVDISIEASHNGYFSIDKNQRSVDTAETNKEGRASAQRAYELIMRNKEELITLENPLRFLFSHSALKEGWDNPNVFQICTLREMNTQMQRRQTIGRGMRICRNQEGKRVHGFEVNTLTVIATESYEDFARNLQHEIENETGIEFGVVKADTFGSLTAAQSAVMINQLQADGHIDSDGKTTDTFAEYLESDDFTVPKELSSDKEKIKKDLKKVTKKVVVKKSRDRKTAKINNEVLECTEFQELWNRIKQKTVYSVELDEEKFIQTCIDGINKIKIKKATWILERAVIDLTKSGVEVESDSVKQSQEKISIEYNLSKFDIIGTLEKETGLTRSTIFRILSGCKPKTLEKFKDNPSVFIDRVKNQILLIKKLQLVEGIKYQKLDSSESYSLELFTEHELTGYVDNMIEVNKGVNKCPLDHVRFDSAVEKQFVQDCELNTAVLVYTKLPSKFVVPTPLGPYNPDWALLIEGENGSKHLYFVAETKSTLLPEELRPAENAKIECAGKHFIAISSKGSEMTFEKVVELADIIQTM